jgi:hypothetical protein
MLRTPVNLIIARARASAALRIGRADWGPGALVVRIPV